MVSPDLMRAALLALLASGCFSEPGVETTVDPSTGGDCSEGQQGCPCYANGTCDGVLACDPQEFLCVPDGCMPGELDCVCADGSCLAPFVCDGAVCVEGGSTSGNESTSDSSSGGASASTTAVDTTAGPGSGESSDATSTSMSETSTVGTSETGMTDCDAEPTCASCMDCVILPEGPCGDVYEACVIDQVCDATQACLGNCTTVGICDLGDCCDGVGDGTKTAAEAVHQCQDQNCPTACSGYDFYVCP